jgi:DNA-binding NtrC family response regulator
MSGSLPSESALAEDRILLVEDDRGHRELLHDELTDAGYRVVAVTDAAEALAAFRETTFAAVVSDLRLPGKDGFHVLECARAQVPVPGFVMLTGFGTIDQAVSALKAGADEFLTKPIDLEHLRLTLQRVLQSRRLRVEVQEYREILGEKGFHGMLGKCPAMLKLFDLVRRVAESDGSVLITGESGTGKELVARALHRESPRKDGPFVAINCAGIPETLLESELFGHAAGSFTGARGARKGLFQEAHGGTLFLDEIGEMPVSMQTKLLRVLQDGKVRPVGANEEVDSDVRVLAATHRDLAEEMGEGRFRQDLFFRLETFRLHVPPVRERGEDIPALLEFFLRRYGLVRGHAPPRFEPAAMRRLLDYRFPGNVRELESLVERAATLARDDWIRVTDLPERVRAQRDPADSTGLKTSQQRDEDWQTLAEVEARYLRQVLDFTGGNKQRAARILGIGRRTLYRRLGEDL